TVLRILAAFSQQRQRGKRKGAMAKPLAVAAASGKAPYGGQPLVGEAAHRGSHLQCDAHRGGNLQRGAHRQRRPLVGTTLVGGPVDQVAARGGTASPQGLPP
ncbi:hypothetical protein GW17_00060409, partial [Ensete ventricosum]